MVDYETSTEAVRDSMQQEATAAKWQHVWQESEYTPGQPLLVLPLVLAVACQPFLMIAHPDSWVLL